MRQRISGTEQSQRRALSATPASGRPNPVRSPVAFVASFLESVPSVWHSVPRLRAGSCSSRSRSAGIESIRDLVIWSFNRAAAQVDIEVRRGLECSAYELVVDYPDGSETVERFENPRQLVERMLRVQRRLMREGWVPARQSVSQTTPRRTRAPFRVRSLAQILARLRTQIVRRLAASFGL